MFNNLILFYVFGKKTVNLVRKQISSRVQNMEISLANSRRFYSDLSKICKSVQNLQLEKLNIFEFSIESQQLLHFFAKAM